MSDKAHYTNDRQNKIITAVAMGIDGNDYNHISEIQQYC